MLSSWWHLGVFSANGLCSCWDIYFISFLQVVYGLSIADSGYVYNTYNIGSCVFAVVIGL